MGNVAELQKPLRSSSSLLTFPCDGGHRSLLPNRNVSRNSEHAKSLLTKGACNIVESDDIHVMDYDNLKFGIRNFTIGQPRIRKDR